jgi:hypothetical protein
MAERNFVDEALACLDAFYFASGIVVNAHKTHFWLVGLDEASDWIFVAWSCFGPIVIVCYLGIPFGVVLSPMAL